MCFPLRCHNIVCAIVITARQCVMLINARNIITQCMHNEKTRCIVCLQSGENCTGNDWKLSISGHWAYSDVMVQYLHYHTPWSHHNRSHGCVYNIDTVRVQSCVHPCVHVNPFPLSAAMRRWCWPTGTQLLQMSGMDGCQHGGASSGILLSFTAQCHLLFFWGGGVGGSGYTSIHLASESVLIQMIAIQSCSGGSGVSILPIPTHLTRLELAWNWSWTLLEHSWNTLFQLM